MTREEAMAILKKEASIIDNDSIEMTAREWDEFDELKRDAIPIAIEALSIEVEQTDCTEFVNWLMEEVMDEDNWELNAVANGEIICRKLKKIGLLEAKDGYYVQTPSIEVVQGEWVRKTDDSSYWYVCSQCGERPMRNRFSYREEFSDYCPNCGAKMYTGGENE